MGASCGGRVFLFLRTDDFERDHRAFKQAGAKFLEGPRVESYGKVAVFRDPYGNKWDLIQPRVWMTRQNIPFGFAASSGTIWSTSQCSTILPSSVSRKMSMPAQM
jgi:hypothetical protein